MPAVVMILDTAMLCAIILFAPELLKGVRALINWRLGDSKKESTKNAKE